MTLTADQYSDGVVDAMLQPTTADKKTAMRALNAQFSVAFTPNAVRTVELSQKVAAGLLMNGPSTLTRTGTTVDLTAAATNNIHISGAGLIKAFIMDPVKTYFVTFTDGNTLDNTTGLTLPGGTSGLSFLPGSFVLVTPTAASAATVSSSQGPPGAASTVPGPAATTAVDQADGNNTTNIANTKFVQRAFVLNTRIRLAPGAKFYVNPVTGNDSNDGLTAGTAFATVSACSTAIHQKYDLNGIIPTVLLANGSYPSITFDGRPLVGGKTVIVRAAVEDVSPGSYTEGQIVIGSVRSWGGCMLYLSHCDILNASNENGIDCRQGGGVGFETTSKVRFGGVGSGAHVFLQDGLFEPGGSYKIIGSASRHIMAWDRSMVRSNASVNISGGVAFSIAFAEVLYHSILQLGGWSYSGSTFTGSRYNGQARSILTNANAIPGSALGTHDGTCLVS